MKASIRRRVCVSVLIGLHAIRGACAIQTVPVVSPAELLNTDGPSFVTPAAFSVHYQQLYAASMFSNLPQGGGTLKDVAFRIDAPSGSQWTALKTGVQITVSTFTGGSLSPIFAENIGADAFRLIDASQTTILNSGYIDPFTPALFEVAFGNPQGFHYDPSLGGLLVDVTGLSVPLLLDSYVGNTTTAVWQSAQDPNSPQGRLVTEGLVTLFRFSVPEPSSYVLFALGLGALFLPRASRRKPKEPNVSI